ncbi:MAG: aminoglycoside phosphotransferase family protein [Thermoleophilia bacterium]|nr:aminoglycoside phosphotransferase family protein [Thermoleophilia bacterium]
MVPAWIAERVPAESWEPVAGGYTRASRWRARLPDGSRAFVKAGEDEPVLRMLRREIAVYESLAGAFLARLLEAGDDGSRAYLVLEDLADAYWPPPWPPETRPLFHALEQVAATPPPPSLPRLREPERGAWAAVADDHEPLLRLGVCSNDWLEAAIEPLAAAEASVLHAGDELVHYDVWSGNLCFAERGVVLVDWSEARVGNGRLDVALALLGIRAEGGRPPELQIPDEAGLAAYAAGVAASGATAPLPDWAAPDATLREGQRSDLVHALRWAASTLGIPPPASG